MKCKTCRHWDNVSGFEGAEIGWGRCETIGKTLFRDMTDWTKDGGGEIRLVLKDEFKDALAATQDGSDYRADLFTHPDFFCAHYDEDAAKMAREMVEPIPGRKRRAMFPRPVPAEPPPPLEPPLDLAIRAYNEVWQSFSGITADDVETVRREAMRAALRAVGVSP